MSDASTNFQFKYWIPAIIAAVCISVFSTHYFSSEQTARFFYLIFKWLFPSATPRILRLMHIAVRKSAHIIEFGIFSITVFHGVRQGRQGWRFQWALITLIIAVAYAGLDEYHQTFVPLREPSARDVLIDGTGALLAQVLVWFYANWKLAHASLTGSQSRLPAR